MKNDMNNGAVVVQEGKTPQDMIRFAVQSGADLEKLEKVLELQMRWEANEAKKAYSLAMAAFKENPPQIDKDKSVSFGTGKTAYKHASLYNVTQKISSELSKNGLSAAWSTKQDGKIISVTCTITHKLGHSESTTLSADPDASGSKNPIQAVGSTVTYLERYTLLALTGLATFEQDTDALPEEPIDQKQLNTILDHIADKQVDAVKFMSYLKVDSLEKMPKSKYQQAMTALENKKKVAK